MYLKPRASSIHDCFPGLDSVVFRLLLYWFYHFWKICYPIHMLYRAFRSHMVHILLGNLWLNIQEEDHLCILFRNSAIPIICLDKNQLKGRIFCLNRCRYGWIFLFIVLDYFRFQWLIQVVDLLQAKNVVAESSKPLILVYKKSTYKKIIPS